jgi:hypothetical protein
MGLLAAAATLAGIKSANDYTIALQRLAVQTGRTVDAIDAQFGDLTRSAANRTGMSLPDTFSIVSEASGVIKDPAELQRVLVGTPQTGGLLDFVNVLQRGDPKSGSAEEIAKNVIAADHILNAYKQKDMARVNESLYRSVLGSHMELGPLVTQLGYFGEQFRLAAGGRPAATDDILKLAELGYWGVGRGKWGAGFGQILRTVLKPSKANVPALESLGILAPDGSLSASTQNASGEFTPLAMIANAIKQTQGMKPMDIQELVMRAFPANAARVFAEALSPKTQGFLQRIDASQAAMPTLLAAQATLMQNLSAQTQRVSHNFAILAGVLDKPIMLGLTKSASDLADKLYGLTQYFTKHRNLSSSLTPASLRNLSAVRLAGGERVSPA